MLRYGRRILHKVVDGALYMGTPISRGYLYPKDEQRRDGLGKDPGWPRLKGEPHDGPRPPAWRRFLYGPTGER